MSYAAYIQLKALEPDGFWDMIQKLKYLKIKNIQYPICMSIPELPDPMREKGSFLSMFKNRHKLAEISMMNVIYWRTYNLMGLIGDPKWHGPEISGLFDTSIYFQNKSDQDYTYNLYNPIPQFRSLLCPIKENDDEETIYQKRTETYRNIETMLCIPDVFDDDTSRTDTIKLTILPTEDPLINSEFCKYYVQIYQKIQNAKTQTGSDNK